MCLGISIREYFGDPHCEYLCLASAWTCNHHHGALDLIHCSLLGWIETVVMVTKPMLPCGCAVFFLKFHTALHAPCLSED